VDVTKTKIPYLFPDLEKKVVIIPGKERPGV
jgi:hypothetical protein